MKRHWTTDELNAHWTLSLKELEQVKQHQARHVRLGFAVLLKYFQHEGRFPRSRSEVPAEVVSHIAQQLGLEAEAYQTYSWEGHSIKRHRVAIRAFLSFRKATQRDYKKLIDWLSQKVIPNQRQLEALKAALYERCRALILSRRASSAWSA